MRENKRYDSTRTFDCPHNEGCACMEKRCITCGWNPAVDKIRKGELEKEVKKRRKVIYAADLISTLRGIKPEVYEEDNGYDRGTLDMWNLLYAAVKAAPAAKEYDHGQ